MCILLNTCCKMDCKIKVTIGVINKQKVSNKIHKKKDFTILFEYLISVNSSH